MPITNPAQLVDEFKKSGEFDRLRRELLTQFRNGDGMTTFMARVDDIARQKLTSDQRLHYMPEAAVNRELMQELDRYPIVERAVSDVRSLSDPTFAASIRESVNKILMEDRNKSESSVDKAEKQAENTETSGSQINDPDKPHGLGPNTQVDASVSSSETNKAEDIGIEQPQPDVASITEQSIKIPDTDSNTPGDSAPFDDDGPQPMQLDSPNAHETSP